MRSEPLQRTRLLLQKVTFACFVCVMALLLLEGGARVVSAVTSWRSGRPTSALAAGYAEQTPRTWSSSRPLYRKDDVLHHVFVPSQTATVTGRGRTVTLTTNAQSWVEDHDTTPTRPRGALRLFFVGDSTVQGVDQARDAMPRIVERELARRLENAPFTIDVVNAGTAGYSPLLYHLLVKTRILGYDPSHVVLCVCANDVADDAMYRRTTLFGVGGEPLAVLPNLKVNRQRYRVTPDGTVRRSFLDRTALMLADYSKFCFYVSRALRPVSDWRNLDLPTKQGPSWLADPWSESTEKNVSRSMAVLADTIRLLNTHGVRVLVTGVPHFEQYGGHGSSRMHDVLRELAKREGATYLNGFAVLEPQLAGSDISDNYFPGDPIHFNAKGNRLWAKALVDFMLDPDVAFLPDPDRSGWSARTPQWSAP